MSTEPLPDPDPPIPAAESERRRAEDGVREGEERFHALFDAAGLGMAMVHPDGRTVAVNAALARMLGYAPEALAALSFADVTHPDDLAADLELARELVEGRRVSYTVEKRYLRADGGVVWGRLTVSLVRGPAGEPRYAVAVVEDVTERRRDDAERAFLAEAGRVLASSLDYDATLRSVARLAVPTLADWCAVDLREPDGRLRRVAVEHTDPARVADALRLQERYPPDPQAPHGVPHVVRTGRPELWEDVPDEILVAAARDPEHLRMLRALGLRSGLVVPLVARGETLGALTLVHADSGRRFSARDLGPAGELAARAAVAIDNARLYAESEDARGRLERLAIELEQQAEALQTQGMELEEIQVELEAANDDLQLANRELKQAVAAERAARAAAERAADRLARLQRVTAALSGAVTPDRVAHAVVEEGAAALGAVAGVVALLDPAGEALEIDHAVGIPGEILHRFRSFPLDAALPLSDAVREGRPVYLGSEAERRALYPALAGAFPATTHRAWANHPLEVDGRMLGGLALVFAEPQPFAPEDRAFIGLLAQQCAQALDRSRLYEAEHRARTRAEAEARWSATQERVSSVLASSLDLRETLGHVGELMVPALAEFSQVYLREGDRLHRVASVCADPARQPLLDRLHRRPPLPLAGPLPHAVVARTGRPMLIAPVDDDFLHAVTEDEEHFQLLRGIGFRSLLVVPLVARGASLGALALGRFDPARAFGEEDLALGSELGRRVALGLDNARLFQAEQRARTEAEAASRAKSDFLATMSHELRTPLNAVLGYVDLLDAGVAGPLTAEQAAYLARVAASGRHLLGLIEEVLTFSRIEADRETVSPEPVRADVVARQAAELVEPLARARGLGFRVEVDAAAVELRTDPGKLRQVLVNLLGNAVKFTDAGEVALVASLVSGANGGEVRYEVRDTGIGIPFEAREKVFEPFWQATQGLSRRAGGTGLGLTVARELARLLGGDVTVESEVGVGSVFTVFVPVG